MHKGKRRVLAFISMVAIGGCLVAGCSAHVSIGGASTVPRHAVETEVATTLARQVHQPVPKVVCPGDLKAQVGTVMYCSLTAQGSSTPYPVKVQVDSISGTHVHFHITVSQTPGNFTPPS
jgi:Domain of unknown function (DUF4333)